MTRGYAKHEPEFREEIARAIVSSNRPIAQVAREFGLKETTVGGWVKKYRAMHGIAQHLPELPGRARLRNLEQQAHALEVENAFLKDSGVLGPNASTNDKYAFIEAKCASGAALPTVQHMCTLLGVSKSGFYDWRNRPKSDAQRRREHLGEKIRVLFDAYGGTYGYRRIHAELRRTGERVGPELVRKLMAEMELVPISCRNHRGTAELDSRAAM